jgi:predicted enzyme related to lactoylglutathione lyase
LQFVFGAIGYTCWGLLLWIEQRYRFETLSTPTAKWYTPWSSAKFSIPTNLRILVQDVNSVSPWYTDKLALRKLAGNPGGEPGVAAYKFKEDGKSVVLTTKAGFGTEKTPILLTKKITRMKAVLAARGVAAGPIEQDRQGTRYFEIHDPEGNAIEVVEAS